MKNSRIKNGVIKTTAKLAITVCATLSMYSSAVFAVVTFDGDEGVHAKVIVDGGCVGCHSSAFNAVPGTVEACDGVLGHGGVDTASATWADDGAVYVGNATYASVLACTDIYDKIDHANGAGLDAASSYGVLMPQGCSKADPSLACLDQTVVDLYQTWVDQGGGAVKNARPQVIISAGTGTTNKGGTFNASVLVNGSALIDAYFKYSLSSGETCRSASCSGQTIADSTLPTSSGGGTTAFSIEQSVNTLSCGKTYYYRAYAENDVNVDSGGGGNRTLVTTACTDPTITEGLTLSRPSVTEDIADQFTLNATDPDNGVLTWSISDNTSPNGEAVVDAPSTGTSTTITYTPASNYAGLDSFVVRVTDEAGGFDEITVNVTVNEASDPPTITEEIVEATPITVSMSEDSVPTAFSLSLTGEDPDPGTTLYWSIDTPAGQGVASVTGTTAPGGLQTITYVPNANINGMPADSFVVGVYDLGTQSGNFDQITVNVNIAAINDAPVAVADAFNVLVNSSGNILDVLVNDTDVDLANEGDTKEIVSVDAISGGGTAVLSGAGVNNTIIYAPATDVVAIETISYTMQDAAGVTSVAIATVSPPDADADGIFDYIDNCAATPNGPLAGPDNQADNDGDQVINVSTTSDPADPLIGGDACDEDDDNDGISDVDELSYPECLDPFNAADATQDCDGDGLNNITEINDGDPNTEPDVDSVGPTVNAPADITVDATGLLTVVNLGSATGNDGNDGEVTIIKAAVDLTAAQIIELETPKTGCEKLAVFETDIDPFSPGKHTVTWASCDSKGNSGHDEQTVNVKPLVSVSAGQSVGEGRPVSIDVVLNGDAISYPATVQYSLSGGTATEVDDYDGSAGFVSFNAPGDVAVISFNTIADGVTEDDETILVTLFSPVNLALGNTRMHTVTITAANVAPQVELAASQGGAAVGNTVYKPDGVTTIVANANDGNGDTLSFDWSASDPVLLAASVISANQIDIDTSDAALIAGDLYKVSVTVSDGSLPVTVERLLLVKVAEAVVLASVDSDGDGFNDDDISEGFADDDADGVPNYLDDRFTPSNVIESHSVTVETSVMIETDPGLRIVKGETAVAAQVDGIVIGMQDLIDHGGSGGSAVSNADTDHTFLSSLVNFEVHGLTDAIESVHVVLPLSSSLQADAVFRKYNSSGWFDFVIDDKNEIASAAGGDGACPQPGSSSYSTGLTAGHLCLQLTIQDGGANDADGVRNFIVKDPGGLALAPEPEEVASSNASGRVGSVSLWFMLLLSITAMAVWRLRVKQKVAVSVVK